MNRIDWSGIANLIKYMLPATVMPHIRNASTMRVNGKRIMRAPNEEGAGTEVRVAVIIYT